MNKGCIWGIVLYLVFNTVIVAAMFLFDGPSNYVVIAENGTNIYSFKNEKTGKVLKKLPHNAVIEVEDVVSPWAIVKLDGKEAYIRDNTLERESTMWMKYDAPLGNDPLYAKVFMVLVSVLCVIGAMIAYGGGRVPLVIPLVISVVEWGYTLLVDSPFLLVLEVLPMPDESYWWAFVAAVLFVIVVLLQIYTLLKAATCNCGAILRYLYLLIVWSAMLIMIGYMLFFAYVALRILIMVIVVVALLLMVGSGMSRKSSSSQSSSGESRATKSYELCGRDCIYNSGHGYCDLGERHKCHVDFGSTSNCGYFKWNGKTVGGAQK
jgi:hypothetical protein